MGRRYKNINIHNSLMTSVFSGDGLRVFKSSLPEGANFITAHFDYRRALLCATYEHESFEIVPEGNEIPFINVDCWIELIESGENEDE